MAHTIKAETAGALERMRQRTRHDKDRGSTDGIGQQHARIVQDAATAAVRTPANVQDIASAAEALSTSIGVVGAQVSQSTTSVDRGVCASGPDAHQYQLAKAMTLKIMGRGLVSY